MTRLQKLRKDRGYSQVKVQMEIGIDQSNYSKIEHGLKKPTYRECKEIALLFETSMDYIAELTDTIEPYPRKNKEQKKNS